MPIVQAVGIAVGRTFIGGGDLPRAQRIEKAMTEAVIKAQSAGITDPEKIRTLIIEARDLAR